MFKRIILIVISLFLAAPVTLADDSSIIPVLWLFAANGMLESQEWNDCVKNVSTIYEYNGSRTYGNAVKSFYLSGNTIYQYNGNLTYGNAVKSFYLSGNTIYQYNGNLTYGNAVKSFYLSGNTIYEYNGNLTYGNAVKSFYLN